MCRSPRAVPHDAINKSPQQPRRHPVTAAAGARAVTAFGSGEAAATAVCLLRQVGSWQTVMLMVHVVGSGSVWKGPPQGLRHCRLSAARRHLHGPCRSPSCAKCLKKCSSAPLPAATTRCAQLLAVGCREC